MADREVCFVPATSAARRSIRRHSQEWKANSASLIQPCVAKYVKGRRQLRLRQEGSPLHLLIVALVLWSCFSRRSQVERWHISHSIRLPRCPIPYDCCRPCYRFRLLLTVPGCLCDAPLRSLLLPGPSGNSHLHHLLNLKPFPHHPSSSSPQCPEGDLLCARHRYIFLFTVLLKAGGDIFHALIMGAYLYIPVYVFYLAMASGLILGIRSND